MKTAIYLIAIIVLFSCAAGRQTADARVRSALDLLAVVIDPAYRIAMDDCVSRETHLVDLEEAGRLSHEVAGQKLQQIRAVCHGRRRAFAAIREGHEEAVKMVEAGRLEEAQSMLERVRDTWGDVVQGGSP